MKIMLIDRDRQSVEQIEQACAGFGDIDLVIEPIKNTAVERLRSEKFDAVFFDPAPQNELRSFIIGTRRGIQHYNPIITMTHTMSTEDVLGQGSNDALLKPFSADDFKKRIENMRCLNDLITRLSDEEEDFPSRDGIISKSAFNQIFLSSLDRADRYGEKTYLTFATIENILTIQDVYGGDVAHSLCESLKTYTMRIRRLSDIAGRTSQNEICLMLMRPANVEEPKLAVNRFSESMKEYADLISEGDAKAKICVKMIEIPTGETVFEQRFE